jgi:hypothetical protein
MWLTNVRHAANNGLPNSKLVSWRRLPGCLAQKICCQNSKGRKAMSFSHVFGDSTAKLWSVKEI